MKYYSLFIHNNGGASTFTAALIHKMGEIPLEDLRGRVRPEDGRRDGGP